MPGGERDGAPRARRRFCVTGRGTSPSTVAARHRPPLSRDQGRGRRRGRRERTTVELARPRILHGSCADPAMIQPKLFAIVLDWGPGTGAQLFPARQFAAAATASLLIAGAFFVCLFSAVDAQAQGSIGTCEDAAELAVLPSPVAPWKGAPLRVIFAAEKPLEGELSLIAPDGSVAAKSRERHGGPPYFWFAEVASPAAGTWHATARARRRAGRVQHDHARDRRARAPSRRGRARRRAASGRCAIPGIARRKTCTPHGSRSCSTRRSTRRRRGRRCTRCCAIDRAMSCSTIWACAKTRWG